jgi:hypothetical protein
MANCTQVEERNALESRELTPEALDGVVGGTITGVTTTTQLNGGGNTPNGQANGVPIVSVTVYENPVGHLPPGQNA